MLRRILVLVTAAVLQSACRAQLDVSAEDMQNAVNCLADRFSSIKNEGLGINALEDALRRASYITQTLTDEEIENLLQSTVLETRVSNILNLFNNITSSLLGTTPSVPPVPSCCSDDATSASLCLHGTNPNPAVVSALTEASLEGQEEVLVGTMDGTILRLSSQGTPPNCTLIDARLQPWFAAEVRQNSNPLEVVLLLDIIALNRVDDSHIETVKAAASLILRSLTTVDTVAMVGLDTTHRIPGVITRIHSSSNPRVVPVCTDTVLEIDAFVTSFTPEATQTTQVDYAQAFERAFSMFSINSTRDQLLIYLSPGESFGLSDFNPSRRMLTAIREVINEGNPSVRVSVYRAMDDLLAVFDNIATDRSSGVFTIGEPPAFSVLGGFYNIPLQRNCRDPACTVTFGHANPGKDLTIRRPLVSNGTFLGVMYATIPFNQLLQGLLATSNGRQYSYPFMFTDNGVPLFHPLLPGDILAPVTIAELEPGVVLDSGPISVEKLHLVYTGSNDFHSSTLLSVPSTYHCRTLTLENVLGMANTSFTTCYVLADEERTLRQLNFSAMNVADMYQSSSFGPPIYHDILETVAMEDRCNYFCKQSTFSRVSFQLTPPSSPPINYPDSFVSNFTEYINGRGSRPSFVTEGLAEEAALGLAVTDDWLNQDTMPSNYITRRHLATPSGLYLTYPPSHLVPEYQPRVSEWYLSPIPHPSLITLGSPQVDPLREGGRLTVSVGYAVRAPSAPDDSDLGDGGPPLAVVSADITLESLRVFIRVALPRCEQGRVKCILVDDSGNLIYERDTDNFNGVARFFADDKAREVILSNLTGLFTKRQCTDLFNVVIKSRRIFTLNTDSDDLFVNPVGHCIQYRVQHVPGTNAFLMVYEERDCSSSVFCPCGSGGELNTCLNCATFNPSFCECPCNCTDDCLPAAGSTLICPLIVPQFSLYDRVASEQIAQIDEQLPFCFQQRCSCRRDFDSCLGVRDCHWCEAEAKCAHVTECCSLDLGRSCCGSPAEEMRLRLYEDTCLEFAAECFDHPVMNVTCPHLPTTAAAATSAGTSIGNNNAGGGNSTSTIAAAVVGGLVGLILVVLIIALIIYYQVCRKPDPAEASSRESAFDFSNKTAVAGSGVGGDLKSPKKSNSENADLEKGMLEEKQEVTPPKDTDETTM